MAESGGQCDAVRKNTIWLQFGYLDEGLAYLTRARATVDKVHVDAEAFP